MNDIRKIDEPEDTEDTEDTKDTIDIDEPDMETIASQKKIIKKKVADIMEHIFIDWNTRQHIKFTDYQKKIITAIVTKRPKRLLVWATTRAGKSLSVALGSLMLAIIRSGEKIRIIAPTEEHSRIIMNYILEHIADDKYLIRQLSKATRFGEEDTVERLSKELSKERITFKNNSEISILSANILQEGRSLVGMGGTTIIVDECETIPIEIVRGKILRMLGDSKDSQLILISNPMVRGFMYSVKDDDTYKKIRITWKDAVREGRLSKEFINEIKARLTAEEFDIWYNCEYTTDLNETPFRIDKVEKCIRTKIEFNEDEDKKIILGIDIARFGKDKTVFTLVETDGKIYKVIKAEQYDKMDTMETVDTICKAIEDYKIDELRIDNVGVGAGVEDRINELINDNKLQVSILGINYGSRADNSERFYDRKSEIYNHLKTIIDMEKIQLEDNETLKKQIGWIRMRIMPNGKLKFELKPEITKKDLSADMVDSLAIAVSPYNTESKIEILDGFSDYEGAVDGYQKLSDMPIEKQSIIFWDLGRL